MSIKELEDYCQAVVDFKQAERTRNDAAIELIERMETAAGPHPCDEADPDYVLIGSTLIERRPREFPKSLYHAHNSFRIVTEMEVINDE